MGVALSAPPIVERYLGFAAESHKISVVSANGFDINGNVAVTLII